MTIEDANRLLVSTLTEFFDEREASSISSLVMDRLTGMPKSLRILNKTASFSLDQEELFQYYLSELMKFRPVQYVLGEAWFGPFPFFVDENVLIPRPETEELTDWLIKDTSLKESRTSVLDIGTGSGCIAVYIKKKRKDFKVTGLDISSAALEIARKNSQINGADVDFILCDIMDTKQWSTLASVDIIISNPPYIPLKQKEFLDKHVRDSEPSLALFAPDEDPILFYKIIGEIAKRKLLQGGAIFLEIHHDFSKEIMEWYEKNGFTLELKKDFSGKNRMIKAFI